MMHEVELKEELRLLDERIASANQMLEAVLDQPHLVIATTHMLETMRFAQDALDVAAEDCSRVWVRGI